MLSNLLKQKKIPEVNKGDRDNMIKLSIYQQFFSRQLWHCANNS